MEITKKDMMSVHYNPRLVEAIYSCLPNDFDIVDLLDQEEDLQLHFGMLVSFAARSGSVPSESLIRFACDCALINISNVPMTSEQSKILHDFLHKPYVLSEKAVYNIEDTLYDIGVVWRGLDIVTILQNDHYKSFSIIEYALRVAASRTVIDPLHVELLASNVYSISSESAQKAKDLLKNLLNSRTKTS